MRTTIDHNTHYPKEDEDAKAYSHRLELDGFEETYIRKALRVHFLMNIEEFGRFFEEFELARLRHLTHLMDLDSGRNNYSLTKKVAKNLGVPEERAEYWVTRFQEVGEVEFVGRKGPDSACSADKDCIAGEPSGPPYPKE